MTITEFILARVAEVEQGAENWRTLDRRHFDQVLAQCEAIRRVVEWHPDRGGCGMCTDMDWLGLVDDYPCDTIRAVALMGVDHPDYREEWRP